MAHRTLRICLVALPLLGCGSEDSSTDPSPAASGSNLSPTSGIGTNSAPMPNPGGTSAAMPQASGAMPNGPAPDELGNNGAMMAAPSGADMPSPDADTTAAMDPAPSGMMGDAMEPGDTMNPSGAMTPAEDGMPDDAMPDDAPADGASDDGVDDDGTPADSSEVPMAMGEDIPCDREFTIPSFAELQNNPKMPDPFTFLDGTKVESKADWVCRQKEISLLAQAFIYGPKPPKPETLTASYADGSLTIEMAQGGNELTLTVPITSPAGASGPVPAVFAVDGSAPQGFATIGTSLQWLTSNVATASNGRSIGGGFYTLYPNSKNTGSLMAWAWAASRIIDALEMTEGHNIDTTKLYGLGCSRNGKTAATMALFDRRMAMVAMHSPGSGSTSGWRPAEAQTSSVQTASQIYGETTWMGEDFGQFGNAVDKLPIDQHEVLALAWPRPLIVREGTNDSWNCPVCVYTTVKYTQMIFASLGAEDSVGFTHYNGGHCEAGGMEWSNLYNAFVDRFIKGDESVSTAGMFTESFMFDAAKWQDGDLPAMIP